MEQKGFLLVWWILRNMEEPKAEKNWSKILGKKKKNKSNTIRFINADMDAIGMCDCSCMDNIFQLSSSHKYALCEIHKMFNIILE